jgi:uncharacterized protein YecE (DUF72 family)
MTLFVGTSGWQYRHWRETFYPRGLAQTKWLEFYADRFDTVESNAAFYRLPEAETFARWAERTPPGFVMAVKASRYLTHILRLTEPEEPVQRLVTRATELGEKLGPILLQLPPTLKLELDRLRRTLDAFPAWLRVAVEFRHKSWFIDEVRRELTDRGAALCLADRRGPITPIWRTTDWTYLRLHVGRSSPAPCYGEDALASWVDQLAHTWTNDEDAYVYFNNDHRACALRDAIVFSRAARSAGMRATKVPDRSEVRLA